MCHTIRKELLSGLSPPSLRKGLLLTIAKGGRTNDNSGLKKLTPELRKGLTDFADENNLSVRELAQLYNMIAIQKFIMECHTIPITQNKTNRRRYTRLPSGKQVFKTKKADLENELISYYAGLPEVKQQFIQLGLLPSQETHSAAEPQKPANTCTLKTIYPQWLELRVCEAGMNTLADDIAYWKDYISGGIGDIPLDQLGKSKLKTWGYRIIKDHSMKRYAGWPGMRTSK